MHGSLGYRRLEPFGVEVDFDLTQEMTENQVKAYRDLFQTEYLLLFRNQHLTDSARWPEAHWDAIACLGPTNQRLREASEGARYVSTDPAKGVTGVIGFGFHSDYAFYAEPDLGLSMYAVDVVEDASSTVFANGAAAYEKLPPALRTRVGDLEALMVWPLDHGGRNHVSALEESDPRAPHPIIWTHPETAARFIYLPETMTDSIRGLPEAQSEELLQELFAYLYASGNIYEHRWRNGDMVVWDNRVLQHGRPPLDTVGLRTLHHVSLSTRTERHPTLQMNRVPGQAFLDPRWAATAQSIPVVHKL
jgi:taurine dioxygenase